jgi:hypothetical protein
MEEMKDLTASLDLMSEKEKQKNFKKKLKLAEKELAKQTKSEKKVSNVTKTKVEIWGKRFAIAALFATGFTTLYGTIVAILNYI